MRVWIDQDLCTGDGLCEDHSLEVFRLQEDGISYVRDATRARCSPTRAAGPASVHVPERLVSAVIDAAMVCPGECIFVE